MRCLTLALLLFCSVAATCAQKPAVPAISGTWNLDLIHSTADPQPSFGTQLVITRYGNNKLQFEFLQEKKPLARNVYTLDGREYPSYYNTNERAFVSAKVNNKSELVVRTRSILDIDGTQEFTETDTWSLSRDGKTLVDKTDDGKVRVYVKQTDEKGAPSE